MARALLPILLCLLCWTANAEDKQNAVYVVPKTDNVSPADPVIAANSDYYSLYIDGVCIDQPETFWKKNVVSFTISLEVNGKPLTIPVYQERAANTSCRIPVTNYGLLSSIPARGIDLKLGASVLRLDNKDTVKRFLTALTGSTSDPILKTYAASSIPYISLVGTIANQLYGTLGPDPTGTPLISFKGTTVLANSPDADRLRLRDMVILQYFGTETLDESKLSEKTGEVYYDGQPLRSGAWITFRIAKSSRRLGYFGREWNNKFNTALQEMRKDKPNTQVVQQAFNDGSVLLFNDSDFTPDDQNYIYKTTKDNIDKLTALHSLGRGEDAAAAIVSSTTPAVDLKNQKDVVVTPVTGGSIKVSPSAPVKLTESERLVISIDALKSALGKLSKSTGAPH